jgi:phosphatidylinositol alpha-1,6-mannosyltransferase
VIGEPEDVQAVASAFEHLLDDDELRASMSVRSRERVETEFAYDVLARRLGETLEVNS